MGRIIVRSAPPSSIDPATLAHSGLWLAPFSAGSPLVGLASAGTSLGNDATEATNPPSLGPSFNGKASISADGVNDKLTLDGNGADYVTDTGYSFWWLGVPRTIATASGVILLDPGLVSNNGGSFGFAINNEGFNGYVQTVAGMRVISSPPLTVDVPVFCCARFEGDQLLVGTDGPPLVAISTPGVNNIEAVFRTMRLFTSYDQTVFLDADTLGMGFSFGQFSNDDFSGIRNWLITEFDL